MRNHRLTTAILGAALALSACSGDGGTGPGSEGGAELTAAQAVQLNQAILGVSAGVRGRATGARSSTAPASQNAGSLNFTIAETAPCQPGGSVGVAGAVALAWDDQAQTSSLSADFGVAHAACGHRLQSGEVITLTGDPDIDVSLDAASGPGGVTSFVIRETGAFSWSKDAGNGGRCTVDVTARLNTATGQVALSGTFCGFPVTGTLQDD
jgi:hypothetical protein